MLLLDRQRRQTIVYWGNPQDDGNGGQTFDPAITLLVRAEQKPEGSQDPMGQSSNVRLIITVADSQEIDMNGYVFFGTATAITNIMNAAPPLNPQKIVGAMRVINVTRDPDIQGERALKQAYCAPDGPNYAIVDL